MSLTRRTISVLAVLSALSPIHTAAQWNLSFKGDGKVSREYIAVAGAIKPEKLRVVPSCSQYASGAEVAYKDAQSTGVTKKLGDHLYSEVNAIVVKHSSLWDGVGGTMYPAGGRSGVKTYLEVRGTSDKALRLAGNLEVWQGAVYEDGQGGLVLSEGTMYRLNGTEKKATQAAR